MTGARRDNILLMLIQFCMYCGKYCNRSVARLDTQAACNESVSYIKKQLIQRHHPFLVLPHITSIMYIPSSK